MFCSVYRTARNVHHHIKPAVIFVKHEHTKCRSELLAPPDKLLKDVYQAEEKVSNVEVIDVRKLPSSDYIDRVGFDKSASSLDKCTEDITHVGPYLQPTFNFAAYINKSETLQQLLKLGVNLYRLEKKPGVPEYILRLDFEKDIKNHVLFFHDLGVDSQQIAYIITMSPFIFKEDLEDMKVRINYLKYKKFDDDMILRILSRNPYWLLFSTQTIDRRLGHFQKEFELTGCEVRMLATKQPRLITYDLQFVKTNKFVVKEEMGFTDEETKSILLNKPKVFMTDNNKLLKTFELVHTTMKIPLEMIAKLPEVLTCRHSRIEQRHKFLEALRRNQYNPKLPNYISLTAIISRTDADFSTEVAKSSAQSFNMFLKTL